MAKNEYYSLAVVLILMMIAVERVMPPGATARKLLQDEPDPDDGGQHKIGAVGSTSHHAGSATGNNDSLSGSVRFSPPTALTYIVGRDNGTPITVTVPFPNIDYSFVPPGIPIPKVEIPDVPIPHVRPPPPPAALGFTGSNNVPSQSRPPRSWYHWP